MKNKNFLLVISKFPPEYAGPGVRIPRLYKWLKEERDEINIQILCNGIEKVKNEKYVYEGYSVRRVTAEYLNKLSFIPQKILNALVYQYEFLKTLFLLFFSKHYRNIHFLHIAGHSGGTAAALVWSRIRHVPVLMELVTEHAKHEQSFLFFFKVGISNNAALITLTDRARKNCLNLSVKESQIWCRPNPINESVFYPEFQKKYELRKKLTSFDGSKKIIVNVAKMIPQKNQFLILKILKLLPEDYTAVIAGPFVKEGPLYKRDREYVESMEKFIKQNNLSARVNLVLDFVNAEEYMKLGDVYVMPAWNEGFGTPMMEAMACGVPVVANSQEIAFQEWIEGGKNGYLCDIQEPEEWAQAIQKVVKFSEEKCLEMAERIREKAGQKAIYSHYEDIIDSLLSGDYKS